MDENKINKTIEIILQNQAQFYADLQMLQETNKEAEKRVSVLERAAVNLFNAQTKTNETVDKLADKVDELVNAQKETDERLRETDERLNAIIFMAEKFFGRNNGTSES
jgi:uncharacterized coiled-coil DUF342 family protein